MDVLCNTWNFNFILYLFIYYFELRLPPSSEVWFVQERYVTFGCSSQSTTCSILNLDGSVERLECNKQLRRSLSVWKRGRGIPQTGLSVEPKQKWAVLCLLLPKGNWQIINILWLSIGNSYFWKYTFSCREKVKTCKLQQMIPRLGNISHLLHWWFMGLINGIQAMGGCP